jgi:AcrR family transcriptional regulator
VGPWHPEAVPRITAASVAEHVAQQRAAVFDAAVGLFVAEGYANVSMGEIAAQVGLARNSLYRYFPDKAHILLEWFRDELPRQAARSAELLHGDGPPTERITSWALDQLDYARAPEHDLLAALPDLLAGADAETRVELAEAHREMLAPLDAALVDAGVTDAADRTVVAELIGGLVLAAGRCESNGPDRRARARMRVAIEALVSDG